MAPQNLFYSLAPDWFLFPLVIIATLATVIASQAVISGAFSLFRQSVQLGFWPRLTVMHTSESNIGQVYLPFVNIALYLVTFALVIGFKKSGNLASAYGIAVSATMVITSLLILPIAKSLWNVRLLLLIPIGSLILLLDSALLIANISKFAMGGWIAVFIATVMTVLMTTWITGRKNLAMMNLNKCMPLKDFADSLASQDIIRTPRTVVFMSGNAMQVPRALLHNMKHNGIMHAVNLIVCVQTEAIPCVPAKDRCSVTDYGQGICSIVLRYGYMQSPNIPNDIANIPLPLPQLKNPLQFSYFLGKESIVLSKKGSMALWRKQLFLVMARNALSASAFFNLPPSRVVEFSAQIEF